MSQKDRLAAVLESIERHLCAIDETQAEQVANFEQLRASVHAANNHLQGIKGTLLEVENSVAELTRATDVDLEEIKKVQRAVGSLSDEVRALNSHWASEFSQLGARVRTTEQLMKQQAPAPGGDGG